MATSRPGARHTIDPMRARISRLWERTQQTTPFRVIHAFGESQASSYALALAFAGFMSMFPMILGALSLVGLPKQCAA
jgi:uncharacterized BrkB/YihY/UPF0761 family membrane protein